MTTQDFNTLKTNFITVNKDEKGYYVTGTKSDFNYIKECAKDEFQIEMNLLDASLQPDDLIRYYFN